MNTNEVIRTCVELVAVNRCSMNAMNYSGIRKLIAGHNPTVTINNQNILKFIDQAADQTRKHIAAILKDRLIMIKYDLVTKFGKGILGKYI